jgi:translation initiation factor IF-3
MGKNVGVMKTSDALKLAYSKNLDLLLIAPNIDPPVARIVNFNKFIYDENRKERANKAKIKKSEVKELRLTPMTSEGDIQRFIKRSKEFLAEGNKVKISVKMRGRQMTHPEVAREKLARVQTGLVEYAKMEGEPKLLGGLLWVVFTCK